MIKSSVKYFELLLFILLLVFLIVLCLSASFSSSVIDGLSLWFFCVLPALFPYIFITTIMSSLSITHKIFYKFSPVMRFTFNTSGSVGYALIISLLSGYPMGAKTVSDLKLAGAIDETESVRASALCSTSSPVFLISTVGGIMFNDRMFGLYLFLIHILSALLVGIAFSFYKRSNKPKNTSRQGNAQKSDNILYDTAYSSIISVLVVGGLITVFYLLTDVLYQFNILSPFIALINFFTNNENVSRGIIFGLFECTKGLKTLSCAGFYALPYTAMLCSFGGFSIICQSLAFLKKAKIKTAPFILSKILSAVLSLILGFIFLSFLR